MQMIRIECSLRLLLPVGSLLLLVGLGPDRLEHLEGDDRGERTDGGDAEVHQVMSPVASSAERWKAKKESIMPSTLHLDTHPSWFRRDTAYALGVGVVQLAFLILLMLDTT